MIMIGRQVEEEESDDDADDVLARMAQLERQRSVWLQCWWPMRRSQHVKFNYQP